MIVTNVDKVVFTGEKWQQKIYQRYTATPAARMKRRPGSCSSATGADPRGSHPADDAQDQDGPAHDGPSSSSSSAPSTRTRPSSRFRWSHLGPPRARRGRFSTPAGPPAPPPKPRKKRETRAIVEPNPPRFSPIVSPHHRRHELARPPRNCPGPRGRSRREPTTPLLYLLGPS